MEGERLIEAADAGLPILDSESEYDLTSANGKKAFRDQLAAAAYYSDDLSPEGAPGQARESPRRGAVVRVPAVRLLRRRHRASPRRGPHPGWR